jgi:hypothetical protein
LYEEHPLLSSVSQRMKDRGISAGLWNALRDMVKDVRNHPEYASDPVAAYRAAGLCA